MLADLTPGDKVLVQQPGVNLVGVNWIRVLCALRQPGSLPVGRSWRGTVRADAGFGAQKSLTFTTARGGRLYTDLALNVSKLSAVATVSLELELV